MALAKDLARALDPTSVMVECGLIADLWQRELLTELPDRVLINCCRQAGKSTIAALIALHTALFQPHSLVLLVSPSLRQSAELFRKVSTFFHKLDETEGAAQESVLRLELSNESRIISLPGTEGTIRGYSAASLVVCDEAARIPDEMMSAVRPTLATSRGKLIAMSTPFGRRGWWYQAWQNGGETWRRFSLTASECPRISAEWLEEERRAQGEFLFSQEYLCEFVDVASSVFASELIEAALSDEVQPLFG